MSFFFLPLFVFVSASRVNLSMLMLPSGLYDAVPFGRFGEYAGRTTGLPAGMVAPISGPSVLMFSGFGCRIVTTFSGRSFARARACAAACISSGE